MMSRVPYTVEQLKKLGLVEKDGVYVKVSSLVVKKVEKLPSLIEQCKPHVDSITESQLKMQSIIGNKKVRNATKSVVNGIKFDSNLEKYMHDLLTGAQIDFEFQKQYILQEKFRYGTEAIRAITLTVDFYLPRYNMICDTKGWANDVAPLKYKMLKWHLKNNPERIGDFTIPRIELPSTKKECELLLNRLLYG